MYLGESEFSTKLYVVKITSTKSSYHLESFDSKFFRSGFTWKFGYFLGSLNMGFHFITKTTHFQKIAKFLCKSRNKKFWVKTFYSSVPNRCIGPNKRAGGKVLKKH